jgi:selenide,water dikinase
VQVLRRLTPITHPDLLVGADTGDDAAVWRWSDDRALVLTTDFITPVVDDPRVWGRVAAANAASDVYAMGGRPFLALNLVGWNTDELSADMLAEVLLGAQDAGAEGGWLTVGGHTVDDPEPKFGLVVVGEVHPDRMLTNAGLRPGQSLVLTKPIGVGVVTTALKRGAADQETVDAAIASMVRLNAAAAAAAVTAGATGATDVTGFGLLGHLGRMARESGVDVEIAVPDVPLLPGARKLAEDGFLPGGSRRNLEWVRDQLDTGDTEEILVALLADAQTSGGLLFGADPAAAQEAVTALRADGHEAAVIGTVTAGNGIMRLRGSAR